MALVDYNNLVPRAHVPFGQHQDGVLSKRHVGSGNEIGSTLGRPLVRMLETRMPTQGTQRWKLEAQR